MKKRMKTIFIVTMLILLAFVSYNYREEIKNEIDNLFSSPNVSDILLPNMLTDIQLPEISVEKPVYNISQIEKEIHSLINEQRKNNELSTLAWDEKLSFIARGHSQDMANRNYFSHDTPEGCDPTCRYSKSNYFCHIDLPNGYYIEGGAENIFLNHIAKFIYEDGTVAEYSTQDEIVQSTVQGWMNSPGHRENILTAYWRNEGIGVVISNGGEVYITQNFC